MTSRKQFEANQRNAKRSTGPRTPDGRAITSRNSLRHGLTADKIMLPDEAADDLENYRSALLDGYAPVGEIETGLVEQIVVYGWRLRRAPRFECTLLGVSDGENPGEAFVHNASALATFSRYEISLSRLCQQYRIELERCQARRHGEAVPAPMVAEITITDSAAVESPDAQLKLGLPNDDDRTDNTGS